jgi:SNF2 family DNA or RNA helicase
VNRNELQRRLGEVMIRNRRAETDIDFTDRVIDTRTFEPTDAEREFYDAVTAYVRGAYSRDSGQKLVLMLFQKEVVSSPTALARTVRRKLDEPDGRDEPNGRDERGERDERTEPRRRTERNGRTESRGRNGRAESKRRHGRDGRNERNDRSELAHREELEAILDAVDAVETVTKERRLLDIVAEARERVEMGRAIVFTQFRATQERILRTLDQEGYTTHAFHGGHSSDEKEAVIERFREEGGVLVSTDAMNEGRNLQFCNLMVNYDLPWNPMRVEQRIGRIHRIGQQRDVYVFNMAPKETIEEYVLERLYDKIDLFTKTVGELNTVLTRLETSGTSFEEEIFDRLVDTGSDADLENDFDAMAVDLEQGTDLSRKVGRFNTGVFDGFDLGAGGD